MSQRNGASGGSMRQNPHVRSEQRTHDMAAMRDQRVADKTLTIRLDKDHLLC